MSITTALTSAKMAEPTPAVTDTNAAENATASKQYLKLAGLILGLSTILLLMLLSFVTPLLNSGAKDLPLAVGGPDMVTTKITQGLEAKSPDAFTITSYSTAEEATEAVRNREAIGAITAGPDGIAIVTASAAGTPYSTPIAPMICLRRDFLNTVLKATAEDMPPKIMGSASMLMAEPDGSFAVRGATSV